MTSTRCEHDIQGAETSTKSCRGRGQRRRLILAALLACALSLGLVGCAESSGDSEDSSGSSSFSDIEIESTFDLSEGLDDIAATDTANAEADVEALWDALDITVDFRDSFVHGEKSAEYQLYIVLHDTEDDATAEAIVDYWDESGKGVAAHFVINKDGSIVQCVPLDKIAHHAGYGDTGHNKLYGVTDESRDDKVGTTPIGDWASDYGMNSYSIGIELVHVGGSGDYPEEQLEALDALIAYLDAYYGFESDIIDHKAWRSGNSDTSEEFAVYLANYQDHRTHDEA